MTQEAMMNIIFCLLAVNFGIWTALFVRNILVWRYRRKLLNTISKLNQQEINNYILDKWLIRYDDFDHADYLEMVWKFWRPCESFFPERLIFETSPPSTHVASGYAPH
jgi:hypothetical protein